MTLLDDYEMQYKIEGVRIVRALIIAPSDLLRRTGVADLLFDVREFRLLHVPFM
jgi:hypothetical protein